MKISELDRTTDLLMSIGAPESYDSKYLLSIANTVYQDRVSTSDIQRLEMCFRILDCFLMLQISGRLISQAAKIDELFEVIAKKFRQFLRKDTRTAIVENMVTLNSEREKLATWFTEATQKKFQWEQLRQTSLTLEMFFSVLFDSRSIEYSDVFDEEIRAKKPPALTAVIFATHYTGIESASDQVNISLGDLMVPQILSRFTAIFESASKATKLLQ